MRPVGWIGGAWMAMLLVGLMATSCATQVGNQKAIPSAIQSSTSYPRSLTAQQPDTNTQTKLSVTYAKLPLYFEPNQGQTAEQVHFLARGRGYTLFLTSTEAVLALRAPRKDSQNFLSPEKREGTRVRRTNPEPSEQTVVRMQLVGANPNPSIAGLEEQPGTVNYFIGNDSTKWRTNIPTYTKVKYQDVYPGVDLAYYGNQRQLEYDFVVAPGANPQAIVLGFQGMDKLAVDAQGALVLSTAGGEVHLRQPFVYQEADGTRQFISGRYVLLEPETRDSYPGMQKVGFAIDTYDSSKPLIIRCVAKLLRQASRSLLAPC